MPRRDPPHTDQPRIGLGLSISYPKPPPRKPPRRRKGGEPEREPVESPRPRPLSGGAAAALEYDA
jgi:hypothetical protein